MGTVRGKDITVEPGTTYVVTDKEYFFNSVTIKQGGVLSIQTNYPVSINSLFKVPAGARKSRDKASASPPKSKAKSSGGKTKSKGKA